MSAFKLLSTKCLEVLFNYFHGRVFFMLIALVPGTERIDFRILDLMLQYILLMGFMKFTFYFIFNVFQRGALQKMWEDSNWYGIFRLALFWNWTNPSSYIALHWTLLNRSFHFWEFWIHSRISQVERQLATGEIPVVFIVGHARSGTTNLEENLLHQNDEFYHVRMADACFQSILMKVFTRRLTFLLELLARVMGKDVKNHEISPSAPIEEPQYITRNGIGVGLPAFFGEILDSTVTSKTTYRPFSPVNIHHIRRHMARAIVYDNVNFKDGKVYLGCWLDIVNYDLLYEHFGNCRLIVTVRDPVKSVRSFFSLFDALWNIDPASETFLTRANNIFTQYSIPQYKSILNWMKTDNGKNREKVFFVQFSEYVKNQKEVLSQIKAWMKLKNTDTHELVRGEGHKNNDATFAAVPEERILREVGGIYEQIQTLLKM